MPAIPASATLLHALVDRDIKNATADPLQVVCAWPVSGQYGPGSRYLYYVLVIACVLARKVEWLKRACLAAALILPAVAAIHGIVLAILHTDDAVDMDLFGAFQLCSIGILAAPVTVKLSDTYFLDRGRNIIFAWTGLILAGLLSLTVEFYRTNSVPCPEGPSGEPLVNSDPGAFPYDETFKCKLQCDIGPGNPWSPMRAWDGSTNNIYVVPAPYVLTFGTATLLAAACCLPAILSLVTMWNRIAEFNWRKRFFPTRNPEKPDDIIEGTNGATPLSMSHMNEDIKKYLKIAVELPVFGGAVLAILVIGEKNFWSRPVSYMTEPIASVGQWGSIVGTGFAVLGSMYVILARKEEEEEDDAGSHVPDTKEPHADHHEGLFTQQHARPLPTVHQSRHPDSPSGGRHESSPSHEFGFSLVSTITGRSHRTFGTDAGNRRKFAGYLSKVSDYIGTPSRKRYDVSEFQQGPAMNYPEIPGETNRNEHLSHLRERWPAASIREVSSRNGSPDSNVGGENENGPHVSETPELPQSPASDQWPTVPPRAARASTLPTAGNRSLTFGEPTSPAENRGRPRSRRDTLEVPSANHLSHVRTNLSLHSRPTIALQASDHSPAIVVSAESEPTSAVEDPDSHVQSYPHGPA